MARVTRPNEWPAALTKRLIQCLEEQVGVLCAEGERRANFDHIRAAAGDADQDAASTECIHHPFGLRGGAKAAHRVGAEFDADEQSSAPDFAYHRAMLADCAQPAL